MNLGERERPDGCITDLRFDAWFSGELAADAHVLKAHLERCTRCRDRRAALESKRDAYLAAYPRAQLRVARKTPAHRLRWPVPAALLGAAAIAALFFMPTTTAPTEPTRRKGGASVGFFVGRTGVYERGSDGQSVRPGDRIRFTYTSDRPAYLAILARDAAGAVSVYFPRAEHAGYVSEGYDRPLESAVELDATLGPERVYALFCKAGFALAGARSALTATHTLAAAEGCQLATLSWTKERVP
jgi:hypothetical protein